MRRSAVLVLIFLSLLTPLAFGGEFLHVIVEENLKRAEVATYSHKADYSKGIADIYLGYDETGEAIVGIAHGKIKTYEKITVFLVMKKAGGAYIVDRVIIPDIEVIEDKKKRGTVLSSINALFGKVIGGMGGGIHAITGATHLHKDLYDGYNAMAEKVIEAMKNNPDWDRFEATWQRL